MAFTPRSSPGCARLSERPQAAIASTGTKAPETSSAGRGLVALAVGGPVVIGHGSISPQQASCSYRNSQLRERGPLT